MSLRIERIARLDRSTAAAVEALVERAAVHERHSPIGEHKFVRLQLGDDDTFAVVGSLAGQLAAYAQVARFGAQGRLPARLAAELLVDPALRGRGIGRAMVERLIAEARLEEVARFDAWAHHADAAAVGLADSFGLQPTRQLWQMALRLDRVLPHRRRIDLPTDARLRTFRRGHDEEMLARLIRDAFDDHPENASFSVADLEARARLPWFDPDSILICEDVASGDPLGLHWMKLDRERGQGEVYILGVVPAAQGRGIGRILLLEGLEAMRRAGMELAFLYVDAHNEPAMALYRQAGFRYEHLDTCYSLEL